MSFNSKLSSNLREMQRLIKLFPSEFDAKYGCHGASQMADPDFDKHILQEFKVLMSESTTGEYESQITKPWKSAKTVRAHFYWGDRGCLPLDEFIYTQNGLAEVKDVYDGMPILGGYVNKPHVFEDDVYELEINKTKFRATGEHPLWVRKYNQYSKNNAKGQWITIDEINKHYMTKSQGKTRWYVKRYHSGSFNFKEISIGKTMAKLLGYLMSDGTFSEKQSVKFTNTNKKLLDDVISLSMELSTEFNISVKSYDKGNGQDLILAGKHGSNFSLLKNKLRELGVIDRTTFGKLQLLQKDELVEFIKGYFNGDGNLYPAKHPVITFYSGIHRKQAFELQFMLWRLGIKGFVDYRKREKDHKGCWEVEVGQQHSVKKLIEILEDIKYPEQFAKAKQNLSLMDGSQKHQQDIDGEWISINKIKKIGRQQVCGWKTLPSHEIISYNGLKTHNSGKTTGMEETAEDYYNQGLNIWHIWGARSYENWFWSVNLNCRAKWQNTRNMPEEMQEQLDGRIHCDCHRAIPSVLIFPDYKDVDKWSVLRFNGRVWKSIQEYSDAVQAGLMPFEITPENRKLLHEGKLYKPDFLQPEIDLIKIAYVTIPKGVESSEIFKKQWIKIVLDARTEARVIGLTPQIFEGDKDKFLVVGEIFKLIPDIADEYFQKLTPEQVGKMRGVGHPIPEEGTDTDRPWTPREKGWNKFVVIANELGTIAPNNKYSRQVESKNAKRPIVDMIPELRHMGSGVWFLGDLQNPDDLNSSVRPQANNVIVKRATKELLGTEFEPFFRKVEEVRYREFLKFGFEVKAVEDERFVPIEVKNYVNSKHPRIEELPSNKGYVVFRNGEYFLETFKMPSFHHRKEGESFRQLTGITWSINKKKLEETQGEGTKKDAKGGGRKEKQENEFKVLKVAVQLKKSGMDYNDVLVELRKRESLNEKDGGIPKTTITSLTDKTLSNKIRKIEEFRTLLDSNTDMPKT